MITIIVGFPGAGKTAKLTHYIYEKILNDSFLDYRNSRREIETLSRGGFSNLIPPPQRHLCYCDYSVKIGRKFSTYYVDGFSIGIPNPFFKTTVFPPYSTIFLDEAQRYYNSRMSMYLREEVYIWYQLHRHNHYNIFMCCQRLGNIDVNIRALAEKIIVLDELKIEENKWGYVSKMQWKGRFFNSCDSAESYCLSRENGSIANIGQPFEEKTDICVFDFYDSFGHKPAFYNGVYNQGFDYYTEEGYQFTLDSFVEFNNVHYYVAPRGYWKNSTYDKQMLGGKSDDFKPKKDTGNVIF